MKNMSIEKMSVIFLTFIFASGLLLAMEDEVSAAASAQSAVDIYSIDIVRILEKRRIIFEECWRLLGSDNPEDQSFLYENRLFLNRAYNSKTHLLFAIERGDIKAVRRLLDFGVNPNSREGYELPLVLAYDLKNTAAVGALIAKGADPEEKLPWSFTGKEMAALRSF